MSIRGMLRAAVLLLLIRTWLADGHGPRLTSEFHFALSTVPDVVLDLFHCKNCANEAVVGKILDRVLAGYDVRLRPNFGGNPVPVGISIYVSRIEQISEINMDYTITLFFHQTWKDSRLEYYETNLNLTLDYRMLDKLWVPDCYFLNSKDAFVHDVTVENRVFQLHPDGTVRYGIRLTTTAACSLDLHKFPLDKQACKLEVESYGYTAEDIILFWEDEENAVRGTEELQIPQFSFLGQTIMSKEVYFHTGSYTRLILRFHVQREANSYLVQIYWPTVLTTILSWISFWMNHDSSAARVTVGLTSMFILTTIDSHLQDKLPQVACIKAIDIYIIVCLFFVFLSLMEYVYINYLFYSGGPQHHRRRRRRARRVADLERYRFQEVAIADVQAELIDLEDDLDWLLSIPAQAPLATPESLGSLASTPERAQLATSESLSSLSFVSWQTQPVTEESLSHLPATSEQALCSYGIRFHSLKTDEGIPFPEIRNRAESRVRAEIHDQDNQEESSSSDESDDHGHVRKPLVGPYQRCMPAASWDLDKICSLNEDVNVESGWLGREEHPESVNDDTWSLGDDDEVLACSQGEDSGSESDDSRPPSPGCSFSKGLSSKLFNPDYVPKIDRWSRVLFPLAFGLFNIAYWVYHIN
ncbi:gamma-aminobutyric acid receptor subunit theta [Choloepus didactylus]|uniref:gamma-aminobutyric acid receptor subunit theta n=1 Tax=Choloepus didactylus TaxID=27675 RepID=UPI00189D7CA2|nr:gamma-aminobutyric acid receptor subunit theta [Choloepus didactylus]